MINEFYFSLPVSLEQIQKTKELVRYSLQHHPVPNIWDKTRQKQTYKLRFTGTLGEIVFADTYQLPRPNKSFGAIDGQDYGKDFEMKNGTQIRNFDIKTMQRKSAVFYENYVLNIPARNILRKDSQTDCYFCMNIHRKNTLIIASFIGSIDKKDVVAEKIGILYKKGARRIRKDGSYFNFAEDTYEIFFKNIKTPFLTERIKKISGFQLHKLRH